MLVREGTTEKLLPVWQSVHNAVEAVGMWLDGKVIIDQGCLTEWQAPQSTLVVRWFGLLPTVCTLLWQELQVPITLRWSKRATGRQPNVVWH